MSNIINGVPGGLEMGDLVLLAPRPLATWLPGRLGGRCWRHVALVFREPEQGEPMIFETAPAGAASAGVRLRRLAKRMATHGGRISARRLDRALSPAQCDELEAWRRELEGRQSRQSLIDLMGAGEDGWVGADESNVTTPLPAELVAAGYQRIGLLTSPRKGGMEARWYTPRHFGERAGLSLCLGYALGPEMPLVGTAKSPPRPTLTAQPA